MISLADSLVSASSRPLAIKRRSDLSAKRQNYLGTPYWVVKEPVGLNYFRFQEEEFAILNMLDGRSSLDEIKDRYEEEFPPSKITVEEIARFVGNLYQSGLLIADVPGQGDQLKKRRAEKRKKELLAAWSNVLAIRFKGIDPDRLLNWLYPKVSWYFTQAAMIFFCLLATSALLLVLIQWEVFQSKLPTFHEFFASENWIWLMVVLGVTKVMHEFGHGLSCKHFGGECHEIGVMILVLTPCLYCNVSDSWMLPNKWHRAAIGAAGMYVEICIASICTFIWWFSDPSGLVNQLCLSVMFVSSVSTILFNGNPLLRYDGYYILADIMEIPNMRQKATSILGRKMAEWCLGIEQREDPFLPQRNQWAFALYTVASVVYRWFVVIMILTFLYRVFEPYGLQVLGQLILLGSLYGLVVQPFWKLYKFMSVPGRLQEVKKVRLYATLGVIAAIVAFIGFVPLPYSVVCPVQVQPHNASHVYVEVAGTLTKPRVKPGDRVEKGAVLVELKNLALDQEIAQLYGDLSATEKELEYLRHIKVGGGREGREAAGKLREVEQQFVSVTEQLKQKTKDRQRLTLVAPVAGYVIPPELKSGEPDHGDVLPTWSGTPFDEENEGAWMQASEMFCQVGDLADLEAMLVIDQGYRPFVAAGQEVEIKLDNLTAETFEGLKLDEIAAEHMESVPPRLSQEAGYDIITEPDAKGQQTPMDPSYEATVILPNNDGMLRVGLRGHAKIHAAKRTIWDRVWRFLSETFSFTL
jgi:putative peptide zinc metalloprotease protein